METKFSVLRAFGSEQFSTAVTFDTIASKEDVKAALETLDHSLTSAFDAVLVREEAEKNKLIASSVARDERHKALEAQLKQEQQSASNLKQAEKVDIKNKKIFK